MSRSSRFLSASLLAAAVLHAQEDQPRRGGRGNIREFLGLGPPPDPVAAARGEKLWAPNCAFCHGPKARGAQGPNLIRAASVLHDEKGETIAKAIVQGVPDKGMPAFANFSEGQLYDIAQFLHLQVELVANRGSYKRLNVVTGDAKAGQAYFNGAGGCNGCHSPTGDLKGIGGKMEPDQLQSRFIWPGGGGFGGPPARAPKATITAADGKPISGTIRHIDDLNVSLVDATGQFYSWPREAVKVQIDDKLEGHRKLLEKYTDQDMHNVTAYLVTLK